MSTATSRPAADAVSPPVDPAWRRAARLVKRSIERALHPVRRRQAIAAVRGRRFSRVVLVCLGNICRSPFAEATLRARVSALGLTTPVESAGLIGPGRPSPPFALAAASELGYDLSGHVSRSLPVLHRGEWPLILVMTPAQQLDVRARLPGTVVVLGDFDPDPIDSRGIPDPFDQDMDVFRAVFQRLDRCTAAVAAALAGIP